MYKNVTRKTNLFEEFSWFFESGTGTGYDLEILLQCGKRESKKVKVLDANSYVCRSYIGKSSSRRLFTLHPKKD